MVNSAMEDADLVTFLGLGARQRYPTGESAAELKLTLPIGHTSRAHLDQHRDVPLREAFHESLPGEDASELPTAGSVPDIGLI